MQHLEGPVAEVDDVPFADLGHLRARLLAERSGVEPRGPRSHEQRFAHVITRPFERRDLCLSPRLPGAERPQRRAAQQLRLKAVSPDIGELVMTADVVIVPVGGDGDDRLADQAGELASDAGQPHPGVHEQVMVAPPDVPDVAAHQRDHVRLGDQGRGLIDPASFEPAGGHRQQRHSVHPSTQSRYDTGHLRPGHACIFVHRNPP